MSHSSNLMDMSSDQGINITTPVADDAEQEADESILTSPISSQNCENFIYDKAQKLCEPLDPFECHELEAHLNARPAAVSSYEVKTANLVTLSDESLLENEKPPFDCLRFSDDYHSANPLSGMDSNLYYKLETYLNLTDESQSSAAKLVIPEKNDSLCNSRSFVICKGVKPKQRQQLIKTSVMLGTSNNKVKSTIKIKQRSHSAREPSIPLKQKSTKRSTSPWSYHAQGSKPSPRYAVLQTQNQTSQVMGGLMRRMKNIIEDDLTETISGFEHEEHENKETVFISPKKRETGGVACKLTEQKNEKRVKLIEPKNALQLRLSTNRGRTFIVDRNFHSELTLVEAEDHVKKFIAPNYQISLPRIDVIRSPTHVGVVTKPKKIALSPPPAIAPRRTIVGCRSIVGKKPKQTIAKYDGNRQKMATPEVRKKLKPSNANKTVIITKKPNNPIRKLAMPRKISPAQIRKSTVGKNPTAPISKMSAAVPIVSKIPLLHKKPPLILGANKSNTTRQKLTQQAYGSKKIMIVKPTVKPGVSKMNIPTLTSRNLLQKKPPAGPESFRYVTGGGGVSTRSGATSLRTPLIYPAKKSNNVAKTISTYAQNRRHSTQVDLKLKQSNLPNRHSEQNSLGIQKPIVNTSNNFNSRLPIMAKSNCRVSDRCLPAYNKTNKK